MKKISILIFIALFGLSSYGQVTTIVPAGKYYVKNFTNNDTIIKASRNTKIEAKGVVPFADTVFYVPSTAANDTITTLMNRRPTGKKALIVLQRGSLRNTTVTVTKDSLLFSSYGTGAKPKISGFTTVTGFTLRGANPNIWVKKVSTTVTPQILLINGVQMAKGRTPNSNRFAPTYASYYHIDDNIAGTVSSVADYSGTVPGTILITTSAAHGITTGDYITLALTPTTYDGSYTATVINSTQFRVTKTYSATATGTVYNHMRINDTEIPAAATNWTGAEVVIRSDNDMNWMRGTVSSHSSNTIYFSNSSNLKHAAGYGYFFQNDVRTLDQNGEWYFSGGSADTLVLYSTTNPNLHTIKLSTTNTLIDVVTRDYVTIKNIDFEGANENAIETNVSSLAYNLTVDNCNFNHNNNGVYGHVAPLMTISNSRFVNNSYSAIYNHYWQEGAHIFNNYIDSTGLVIGSGTQIAGSYIEGTALYSAYGRHNYTSQHTIIEKNRILNSGYNGIWAGSDSAIVRKNYINKYNMNKSDGGAIYTGVNDSIYLGMKIQDNICLNGVTSTDSTGQPQYNVVTANYNIYLDNTTDGGTTVSGNTCANTEGAGLMVHMSKNVTITNNTFYDCRIGVKFQELSGYTTPEITGITMNGNKIISKKSAQKVMSTRLLANTFATMGTINNNYYAKPMDGYARFITMVNTFVETERDSASWRTYASQDANSIFNKIQVQNEDSIRLYTNPTNAAVTYALNDTLIDVTGAKYNTSVTVPAWGSKVLWNDDAAVYTPVFLGVASVGASAFNSSIRQAMPVTMPVNGTIMAISMYMGANTTTTGRVKLAIYSDSGALPSTKLAETEASEQLTFAGFLRLNLITPIYVASGTTVWYAWIFEHQTQTYYTAGTPGRANTTGTTFADGMPTSFGTSTTASSRYTGGVYYK